MDDIEMIKRRVTAKSKPFGCDDIVIPAGRTREIFKKKLTKGDANENQRYGWILKTIGA